MSADDAVVNWDAIVHKNVRSKDGQDAGNVDAIEGNTVVITSEGDRQEYNVPKSEIEGLMVQKSENSIWRIKEI